MTYAELVAIVKLNTEDYSSYHAIINAVDAYTEASNGAKPIVRRRLPSAEDIKRWHQLLVGFGEEKMMNDVQATFA